MSSASKESGSFKDGLEQSRTKADDNLTKFEERLQKAIDDTLALLGPNRKRAFCMRLKDDFNLESARLAQHPETLSSALDAILGPAGQIVGRAIAKKAAVACGTELPEDRTMNYADLITSLKQSVRQKGNSVTSRILISETQRRRP